MQEMCALGPAFATGHGAPHISTLWHVRFRVLGGVAVVGDDDEVRRVTARRQRGLLALLILNPNRVMSSAVLINELWGDALPDAPVAALQVVVSRLRTRLGTFGNAVVAEPGGYRLDVGPDETDLLVAEALLRDGRAALARNEATVRGRARSNARSRCGAATHSTISRICRLRETRRAACASLWLSLVEARNDALLIDGRHLEVLADIEPGHRRRAAP